MPIRVPGGEKIITDKRLTAIRVISTLADKVVGGDEGLKEKVKAAMVSKDARFAESDVVIAHLRAGNGRGPIDPHELYKLVKKDELTIEQFLDCVTVQKKPLEKFLAGGVIDKLCGTIPNPAPILVTEFKEGVDFEVGDVDDALAGLIKQSIRTKAA